MFLRFCSREIFSLSALTDDKVALQMHRDDRMGQKVVGSNLCTSKVSLNATRHLLRFLYLNLTDMKDE